MDKYSGKHGLRCGHFVEMSYIKFGPVGSGRIGVNKAEVHIPFCLVRLLSLPYSAMTGPIQLHRRLREVAPRGLAAIGRGSEEREKSETKVIRSLP
jgi:hypothetical protein